MELAPEQLLIASGVAMGIIWVATIIWMKLLKKPKPSREVMKVIAFVAATALAYLWTPIKLPDPNEDLFVFVTALLVSALSVFKVAQLIYDQIWRRITDRLGSSVGFLAFLSVKR